MFHGGEERSKDDTAESHLIKMSRGKRRGLNRITMDKIREVLDALPVISPCQLTLPDDVNLVP